MFTTETVETLKNPRISSLVTYAIRIKLEDISY